MEINGEATQGITHTRAIELIQAGGNRVHLLLRAGQGLVPDHSEWPLSWAGCSDAQLHLQIYLLLMEALLAMMPTEAGCSLLYAHACVASFYLDLSLLLLCFCLDVPPLLFDLLWFSASAQRFLPIYLLLL